MELFQNILIGPDAPPMVYWVTVAWVFVVGAAIGSFLNVVIYRLPRGMSVVHPGSRCGSCGHAIRWYDNLPVVSWFILGGRCRDCGSAFSIRYPLIEAATGAMFVALAMAGPLAGEPAALRSQGPIGLWGMFALRVAVICALWSAAWITSDGHHVPFGLHLTALGFGAAYAVTTGPVGAVGVGILLAAAAVLTRFGPRKKSWTRNAMFLICLLTLLWFAVGESLLARSLLSL